MNNHLNDPLPEHEGIDTGSELNRFLNRLVAKDPAGRFQHAGEALAALNQFPETEEE
jgi:hypothetical protein